MKLFALNLKLVPLFEKRCGDLESVRKELDAAWERYDNFYENHIAENLPEGELGRV